MFRIKTLPGGSPGLRECGGSDDDGQSAKPDDVAGDNTQRPARITGVPAGTILSANSDLFNKTADRLKNVFRYYILISFVWWISFKM